MEQEKLYLKVRTPIGEIVLNQPLKRNAISEKMWHALGFTIAAAESDPAIKVIIIRGEGEHFAAGADISEFEHTYATSETASVYTKNMLSSLAVLENCTKPTIAMIDGACVGGGCSIALACDLRIASDRARFGITPGKLGLVYSVADTRRLVDAVGKSKAKDLLFTGRLIDSSEALEIGLCNRIHPYIDLQEKIDEFANSIAATSQWSVRATKNTFKMLGQRPDDAPEAMSLMLEAFEGADFKEGYRAFLEKRKPNFPTQ